MQQLGQIKEATDFIFANLGKEIRMAAPLGLGKPNQLINAVYDHVKNNKELKLKIFTALSLDIPDPKSDLEARFTKAFYQRHFGDDYPRLTYVKDLLAKKIPENIEVEEFYFQAGKYLGNTNMQCHYNSLNYTHVTQSLFNSNINLLVQLIAVSPDGQTYSLSCNPDLTLDVVDIYRKSKKPLVVVGVIHPELPFLGGDAQVEPSFFDAILTSAEITHQLFAPPLSPMTPEESLIGLHASQLIPDDGTLQIGIGSLSEALVYATILRHQKNQLYRQLNQEFWLNAEKPKNISTFESPFEKGLYGTSEMLMDGFMHLRNAGILCRRIYDRDEYAMRYLHGAFFLGSKKFYQWLRELKGHDYEGLSMTRVSKVNDLYDPHEFALRRQRKNARFFNTTMNITLLGGAASETLENGQVISGVGGQYNFVAMSHELPDSHSVLMLRSTRITKGKRSSNIVWAHGQLTIPRHLRDIVITEYGIAYLKEQNDEQVIQQLLNITDSEFQEELLKIAKKNKKIAADYKIPEGARHNTPTKVRDFITKAQSQELFPRMPFGSDFTATELTLQSALIALKESSIKELLKYLLRGLGVRKTDFSEELLRMDLQKTSTFQQKIYQKILLGSLQRSKTAR